MKVTPEKSPKTQSSAGYFVAIIINPSDNYCPIRDYVKRFQANF